MRPGVLTSEFWVTIFTALYLVLNNAGVWQEIPTKWSAIAMAIIVALYNMSRGVAKHGVPHASTFLGLGRGRQ